MMEKTLTVVDQPQTGAQQLKSQPERFTGFLHDVRGEMRKVITPTRAEVQANTGIVVGTVFVFAAYFWVVDTLVGRGIERILGALTRH